MNKESLISFIRFSIIPGDDPKQAIRLRRFFLSVAAYIICTFTAYICYLAGFMEWETITGYLVMVPVIIIALYIVFRTGLNLRMADPSLTSVQIYIGILVTMYGMYFANEARGVLLLIYVIILIFGIFRLNTRKFIYLSLFTLLTYTIDIVLLHIYRPGSVNLNVEYLQLAVLALVLAAFSVIGGYISAMRHNLSISKSQQAKYIEIIHEMAIRDELTGLHNRRHVMELLEYEKNRSSRGANIFCLAMLDIDHFKSVNDNYGHQAGDKVLREVAILIKNNLRNAEFCGRYGGEEFLIVLTQTDIQGALVCAERVRANIEHAGFPGMGADFKVTVSIGLSEYQACEDIEKIISRADEALYSAKNHGRNRVETA